MPAIPGHREGDLRMDEKQKRTYWIGVVVLILLATMTIGEFFIGLYASAWWAPLLSIAMLKAFFILRDYMHIGRAFAAATDDENEVH